jgi:alpha-galactosidase
VLRALTLSALTLVAPGTLLAGEARVEAGPDGRSWTLANGLVERVVAWTDESGLRTTVFRRMASGTDFLRPDEERRHGESQLRVDGEALRVSSSAFELIGAEVVDLDRGGRALEVRLRRRGSPLGVTVRYGLYEGHPVTRKWVRVENRGEETITLTGLAVDDVALAPGRPNEIHVSGFYGTQGRETFMSGRVDDGLILMANSRSGEGLAVLNEAPGYLKRTDILSYAWRKGVRCGYDTDLFPFERSLAPGEVFTSAACSIGVFAEGEGLADPGYVLPSYASDILLRLGSAYQPPWIYNTWEPFMRAVEEETTRELVSAAAPVGFDIFTIDDGWQKTHGANDVWEETFPSGLEPIQEEIEAAGMRLGLWYPLAAVDPTIPEYVEHPEWAARERDGGLKTTGTAAGSKVVMCLATPYRARAARRLADLIRTYNLAYVKIDLTTIFNTYGESPGCHAEGHEHRTWAESLTRIYEGMKDFTARVYAEHPEVLLDLTFELWGKKHLIDPGLLAAGDLDWLSNVHDATPDSAGPLQVRTLLYHRARAVPVEAMLIGNLRVNSPPAEVRFATAIGAGPVLLGDPRALSGEERAELGRRVAWFKALRRELPIQEGFFPQGEWRQPGLRTWDGFARLSREGEGLLVLFRNEADTGEARVAWSAPGKGSWVLKPPFGGAPLGPFDGAALQAGVPVALPDHGGAALFEVRRAGAGD